MDLCKKICSLLTIDRKNSCCGYTRGKVSEFGPVWVETLYVPGELNVSSNRRAIVRSSRQNGPNVCPSHPSNTQFRASTKFITRISSYPQKLRSGVHCISVPQNSRTEIWTGYPTFGLGTRPGRFQSTLIKKYNHQRPHKIKNLSPSQTRTNLSPRPWPTPPVYPPRPSPTPPFQL